MSNFSEGIFVDDESMSMVHDLQERVRQLKSLEPASEIHAHCDDIESEILLSFDSAIERLNQLKDELLSEIASYRSGLLQAQASVSKSDEWAIVKQELDELSKEMERLYSQATAQSNKETSEVTDRLLEVKTKQANKLRRRIRDETFGGRFIAFEPYNIFSIQADHLGSLVFREHEAQEEYYPLDIIKSVATMKTIPNCNVTAMQSVFGEFNCYGFDNGKLLVVNYRDRKKFHFNEFQSPVLCMTNLMDGMLAVGCENGALYVPGLKRMETLKFSGHSSAIFSVKRLKERTFASMSTDNTNVWKYETSSVS